MSKSRVPISISRMVLSRSMTLSPNPIPLNSFQTRGFFFRSGESQEERERRRRFSSKAAGKGERYCFNGKQLSEALRYSEANLKNSIVMNERAKRFVVQQKVFIGVIGGVFAIHVFAWAALKFAT